MGLFTFTTESSCKIADVRIVCKIFTDTDCKAVTSVAHVMPVYGGNNLEESPLEERKYAAHFDEVFEVSY